MKCTNKGINFLENKLKVICGDCLEIMPTISNVDVVVTSPVYNLNIKYNTYKDDLAFCDYWNWIDVVIKNIYKVLKDNGSFFLNVGSSCKEPCLHMKMCQLAINAGFILQNNIVWVKSITVNEVSSGHFKPINSKRYLNDQHESIFHFTKTGNVPIDRLAIGVKYADKSNLGRYSDVDLRCRGNTWFIPYKTVQKKKEHPAGFPIELPEMCIKLAGVKSDMVVLDPFLGCGSSLLACKKLGVNGIGIELDQTYCQMAVENLTEK